MSNFFRDLTGQGASSRPDNTKKWLQYDDDGYRAGLEKKQQAGTLTKDEEAELGMANSIRDARAKQAKGEALTEGDKGLLATVDNYKAQAKKDGIEAPGQSSTMMPDFTDKVARAKKMGQMTSLMAGRGRKSSFLGGDYGSDQLGAGSMLGGTP